MLSRDQQRGVPAGLAQEDPRATPRMETGPPAPAPRRQGLSSPRSPAEGGQHGHCGGRGAERRSKRGLANAQVKAGTGLGRREVKKRVRNESLM